MKISKVLTLLFTASFFTMYTAMPAAQAPAAQVPLEDLLEAMQELGICELCTHRNAAGAQVCEICAHNFKNEGADQAAPGDASAGAEAKMPGQQRLVADHLETKGYRIYGKPAFAQHLAIMTKKMHEITQEDVDTALAGISEDALCASFPVLAEYAQGNIKRILSVILQHYLVYRTHWKTRNGHDLYIEQGRIFWCSPSLVVDEEERFVIILQQLNDILQTYSEYRDASENPLVITEFGEEGCLQVLLLTIGLFNIGYYNITLNLIGGPDSHLLETALTMGQQLHALNMGTIAVNAYVPCKSLTFLVEQNKPYGNFQIGEGKFPPTNFPGLYFRALDKHEIPLSHCTSMTDAGISSASQNPALRASLLRSMVAWFNESAHRGAADVNKTLVYTLNNNLMRFNCSKMG